MIGAKANNLKDKPQIKVITKTGQYSPRNKAENVLKVRQQSTFSLAKQCLRCGGMNHFARVCSSTSRKSDQQVRPVESYQAFGIHYTTQEEENLEMKSTPITVQVDPRGDVAVITEKHYEMVRNSATELKATVRR